MNKFRITHWSCSRFADIIRGEKKPMMLSLEDWEKWRKEQQKTRPFRYWFSDKVLPKIQDVVYYPYDMVSSIKNYYKNRFVTKTHYLKTGLPPGQWYDFDIRILHALFNELVEFVEIELAHLSKWDSNKKYKFKNGRCIRAAYDYFEYIQNDFDQIKNKLANDYGKYSPNKYANELYHAQKRLDEAQTVKKLYEWWTIKRPKRQNPYYSISKKTHGPKYYELIEEIYQDYNNEDTNMLIELIKIRQSLWS